MNSGRRVTRGQFTNWQEKCIGKRSHGLNTGSGFFILKTRSMIYTRPMPAEKKVLIHSRNLHINLNIRYVISND